MASLLFQGGKVGSSSSSSSSSSANPLQALAHFYEQELTDNHIDARLQNSGTLPSPTTRQFRQQQRHYPKQQPRTFDHSSRPIFPPTSTSKGPHYQRSISEADHGYQTFSSGSSTVPGPPHSSLVLGSGHANADISEYLKQRQEYYMREAHLRSLDRNDGLGPIIDFSAFSMSPEPGDHLATYHHNPYAHQSHHKQNEPYGLRATSQQEQVLFDIAQAERSSKQKGKVHEWNDLWGQLTVSGIPLASSSTSKQQHQQHHANSGSLTSSFVDAAAAIPSSWPMAPWAIETQAAILEFETLYKDYDSQLSRRSLGLHAAPVEADLVSAPMVESSWTAEFAQVTRSKEQSESAQTEEGLKSNHELPSADERRGSVKTCGFMFDAKRESILLEEDPNFFIDPPQEPSSKITVSSKSMAPVEEKKALVAYNDDVFEEDMLKAWMETLERENHEEVERRRHQEHTSKSASERPMSTLEEEEVFDDDVALAWKNMLEQEKQETDERIQEKVVDPAAPIAQMPLAPVLPISDNGSYVDDVFEADMAQSWMSVLEVERLEAEDKEREKRETEHREVAKDKVIQEMALRRLNALMLQLDQSHKSRLGLGQDSTMTMQS
ncbi:hypothetical protein BG004_002962 [Podila humilis]|nr:hypothetical protein BG004_002962 [Podila humilis]